jgi:predicted transcriptional regulator
MKCALWLNLLFLFWVRRLFAMIFYTRNAELRHTHIFLYTQPKYVRNRSLIMRRSKLEMHVDVLKVLARHGPLKLTHIMYKANVNCSVLKEYLDFLIQHNLVEEQTSHKKRHKTRVVYAITKRGRTVLKHFREINTALQMIEEAKKIPALLY